MNTEETSENIFTYIFTQFFRNFIAPSPERDQRGGRDYAILNKKKITHNNINIHFILEEKKSKSCLYNHKVLQII